MKFDKKALYERLGEKTTWLGVAIALGAYLGLEPGSSEQMAGLLASVAAMLVAEKK